MKWKCLRCETIFDDENKKCSCVESPSPWVPYIEIQFERVEVKAGPNKLEGWTIEFDEVWDCSDEWREMMERPIDLTLLKTRLE
jgi:hypothetical protein